MGTTNKTQSKVNNKTLTSIVRGSSRRDAARIWSNLAESEARMNLLKVLVKEGRGVAELEEFNLGLASKFKSKKFKSLAGKKSSVKERAIVPAMKVKLADEQCYARELMVARSEY